MVEVCQTQVIELQVARNHGNHASSFKVQVKRFQTATRHGIKTPSVKIQVTTIEP